jgi:hypothetical protein
MSNATSDAGPRRLGDFAIVRELGRGGMGVVYEAVQTSLNRRVALKVLGPGLGLTPQAVTRFRREAAAAARLHHTHIVPVYATGEQDGHHFYAMELIDGPSLDRVLGQLREQRGAGETPPAAGQTVAYGGPESAAEAAGLNTPSLSSGGQFFDAAARMLAGVADALDYAHQQGVLHRDVKPANLLVASDGRLSLNDFGLARVLEEPGMTQTGEFLGTPAYMAPEQITGGRVPVDGRADVYALGATLYEMLTLRPPFVGASRDQVLAQILQKEPTPPRKLNPKVPVDLETICLKCLEKDPDRRYATAGALAEDLRRYVNRFAIAAKRAGPAQRLVKWVRRHPALAASLGCLLLTIGVALAFAYRAQRAEHERLLEQEQARLQLLEEKIRNAYLVATSGDLKTTDDAIKEIETLGASTGQVRLLRGVVAYFRQDTTSAISELEQAVKLLTDSVAARALLASACADAGQEDRYEELSLEMQRLSPTTPEDFLFKGYARQVNEAGRGLADVDEGIRRRDSPLGRALRAIVRANQAIDSGKPQDAEAALADADVARGMLPNNQLALYASVYARLAAAAIDREAGLAEKRRAVLAEAARDVRALDPFIGLTNPAWMMWQYYDDIGDADNALKVARRALDRSGGPIATVCADSLCRQGRFPEALQCLDQRRRADVIGDVTRAFVLAELPGGPRRALDECDALARRYRRDVWELRYRGYLWQFLGRKEQARASLRGFRRPYAESEDWKEFFEAMRQFGCGELSEDPYLVKAGESRWKQGFAHFEIGLSRLADGDRAGARKHFAEAVNTHAIWLYQWSWSRMFLSRLENDPKWPPWIAAKQ